MNKKLIGILVVAIAVTGIIINLSDEEQNPIYVQAAASMQNALTEIETNFESQGYDLQINYGGSGTLVTQIQEGAPADLFILASKANFETLDATNPMVENTNLVGNELVLIAPKDSSIKSLDDVNTIAIGTPEAVPAGTYAMQVLDGRDLTSQVSDKLVQTKDVSEVLTYVETGNADLGFVYNTDAVSSDEVQVVYRFGADEHDPIEYPIGLLTDSSDAKAFYDYLQTEEAQAIFGEYGFVING